MSRGIECRVLKRALERSREQLEIEVESVLEDAEAPLTILAITRRMNKARAARGYEWELSNKDVGKAVKRMYARGELKAIYGRKYRYTLRQDVLIQSW